MAIYKGAYIFEGKGYGWEELWFWVATQSTLDLQGARFLDTLESRRLLLGKEYAVKAIRVSEELNDLSQPVIGDSWLQYKPLNGYTQEAGCQPAVCLQVKSQTIDRKNRRNIYMRGVWDNIETNGGDYDKAYGGWDTKFQSWVTKMKALGVGWIHRTPVPATSDPPRNILSAEQNDGNGVTITLEAPGLFGVGPTYRNTKINIRTAANKSVLTGLHVVLPTSATVCKTVKPMAIFETDTTGWTANTFTFAFALATFIEDTRITRRPPGRPLLASRGREAARAQG